MIILETERLLLRTWKEEDAESYYQINQDPRVIEFLLCSLSMEEVKKFIADKNRCFLEDRYTLWAVEEKVTAAMIGFVGLQKVLPPLPFAPAVEIGWRLDSRCWGRGYATEAAKAVLSYAWNILELEEIVSCTFVSNHRSRNVMEKIGMKHDEEDNFNHSKLPEDHRLSKHVLYRLKKSDKSCM